MTGFYDFGIVVASVEQGYTVVFNIYMYVHYSIWLTVTALFLNKMYVYFPAILQENFCGTPDHTTKIKK